MGDSSSPALPLLPPTLGSPPSAGPSLTDRPLSSGLSSSQKAGLQRAPPSGTSHKHKPGCELQGGSWALPASGEQSGAPPAPPTCASGSGVPCLLAGANGNLRLLPCLGSPSYVSPLIAVGVRYARRKSRISGGGGHRDSRPPPQTEASSCQPLSPAHTCA